MNEKEFEQHCKAAQELLIQYALKHSLAREHVLEIVGMLGVTLQISLSLDDEQPAAATTEKPN